MTDTLRKKALPLLNDKLPRGMVGVQLASNGLMWTRQGFSQTKGDKLVEVLGK